MFRPRYVVAVLLLCFLTACSSTAPLVLEPTQTLISPTITATSIPITPTITLTPLPRASDLSTPSPAIDDTSSSASAEATLDDPVAAELVGLAQRRVAEIANFPVRRVQVIEVKSYTWTDVSLGCPSPDETYTKQQVDGYRIVLSANDQQYIFHTDFDRVVACDTVNEKLPESPAN
jgi:hypothetical protein